jgi:hypothetical protein
MNRLVIARALLPQVHDFQKEEQGQVLKKFRNLT